MALQISPSSVAKNVVRASRRQTVLIATKQRGATRKSCLARPAQLSVCSPHPDAIRRRQEAEARRTARAREMAEGRMLEAAGVMWYEGSLPPNMVVVRTPSCVDLLTQRAMKEGRTVLINFFQDDCYACRTLHPKLKKMATDHPEVLFLKVNGSREQLRPLFEAHGITKVPFFHAVRDGAVQSRFSASLSPEKLARLRQELQAAAVAFRKAAVGTQLHAYQQQAQAHFTQQQHHHQQQQHQVQVQMQEQQEEAQQAQQLHLTEAQVKVAVMA